MRQTAIASVALVVTLGASQVSVAQPPTAPGTPEPDVQSVRVPFSDPSRPGRLKLRLVSGSITVRQRLERVL